MKKLKKIVGKLNKNKTFKPLLLTLLFALFFLQTDSTFASNDIVNKHKIIDIGNPTYTELFNRIKNNNECFSVKVSSVSTKNNNYAFVSYATGTIKIKNAYNLSIPTLQTEFDDRSNFQGSKTRENIDIFITHGNQIGINVNLETWGHKTLRLTNTKITKERFGYFITGHVTDGNRTVYYTIGIYKTTCLF